MLKIMLNGRLIVFVLLILLVASKSTFSQIIKIDSIENYIMESLELEFNKKIPFFISNYWGKPKFNTIYRNSSVDYQLSDIHPEQLEDKIQLFDFVNNISSSNNGIDSLEFGIWTLISFDINGWKDFISEYILSKSEAQFYVYVNIFFISDKIKFFEKRIFIFKISSETEVLFEKSIRLNKIQL